MESPRNPTDGTTPPSIATLLWRGARGRCPHCAVGPLFVRWNTLHERCPVCGLAVEPSPDESYGLTYLSAGAITGLFILVTFLVRLPTTLFERALYFFVAMALIVGTMPYRKGMVLGIVYLIRFHHGEGKDAIPRCDAAATETASPPAPAENPATEKD